jgi:hypothetical protein
MFKDRWRLERRRDDDWKAWTRVAEEGRRINMEFSRESKLIAEKTKELVDSIKDDSAA